MTDERLRQEVWTEMLSAERTVRYYGRIAVQRGRMATVLLATSVITGSSGVGAFLESLMASGSNKTTTWFIAIAVIAGCLNWICKFADNASKAEKTRLECDLILSRWKSLWGDMNSPVWDTLPRKTVTDRLEELRREMTIATEEGTRFAGETWWTRRLNQRCAAEAYEATVNAYRVHS